MTVKGNANQDLLSNTKKTEVLISINFRVSAKPFIFGTATALARHVGPADRRTGARTIDPYS